MGCDGWIVCLAESEACDAKAKANQLRSRTNTLVVAEFLEAGRENISTECAMPASSSLSYFKTYLSHSSKVRWGSQFLAYHPGRTASSSQSIYHAVRLPGTLEATILIFFVVFLIFFCLLNVFRTGSEVHVSALASLALGWCWEALGNL